MPSATPSTVATAVRPSENTAPRSSSGQSARTAAKSSWIIACRLRPSVGQVAGRTAQPLRAEPVDLAAGLGRRDDLVDLLAQLVVALGHADEVGRVLEQQLELGAQLLVARHHVAGDG